MAWGRLWRRRACASVALEGDGHGARGSSWAKARQCATGAETKGLRGEAEAADGSGTLGCENRAAVERAGREVMVRARSEGTALSCLAQKRQASRAP